jgi:hypothetical protein
MTNQIAPSWVVDPIISPRAHGGLITTVEVVTSHASADDGDYGDIELLPSSDDRRWESGYTWRPLGGCGEAGIFAPCDDETKTIPDSQAIVEVIPPTVYAGFKCSTWGLLEEERMAHAEARLNAREGQAIERELWAGAKAQAMTWPNPYLASPATTVLAGGATVKYLQAFAALQEAIGDCLGSENAAVLHMTRRLATLLKANRVIGIYKEDGWDFPKLVDQYGNYIVAGTGYDGSGPGGSVESATQEWAYATGAVRVDAGPVYMTPDSLKGAVSRDINNITFIAERTAAAAFDSCCTFGVLCDMTGSGLTP